MGNRASLYRHLAERLETGREEQLSEDRDGLLVLRQDEQRQE